MPAQNPNMALMHQSIEPNWRTPDACFLALRAEFLFGVDLAADESSSKCVSWLGPGSVWPNALDADWVDVLAGQPGFLNPPFSRTLQHAYSTGTIRIGGQTLPHPKDPSLARVYDIANWAQKCWAESRRGATIVGVFPFAPQTEWYRAYVYGHQVSRAHRDRTAPNWTGHAALQERRIPHRISFQRPDGSDANNAGVNSVIVVWGPGRGLVGPWLPWTCYWSYK